MDDDTAAIVRLCWARELGLPDTALAPGRTVRVPDPAAAELLAVTVCAATAVLGPPDLLDRVSPAPDAGSSVTALLGALGPGARLRTHDHLHHTSRYPEVPVLPGPAEDTDPRAVVDPDPATAIALLAATPPDDRRGFDPAAADTVFTLRGATGTPVAAGGYRITAGMLAEITVVTAPAQRRSGHGLRLLRALIEHALDDGLIPQFRRPEGADAGRALLRRAAVPVTGLVVAVAVGDRPDRP